MQRFHTRCARMIVGYVESLRSFGSEWLPGDTPEPPAKPDPRRVDLDAAIAELAEAERYWSAPESYLERIGPNL